VSNRRGIRLEELVEERNRKEGKNTRALSLKLRFLESMFVFHSLGIEPIEKPLH